MDLFDDFIINSDFSGSVLVTWQYVASDADLATDEFEQPDWTTSTITSETFFAIPGGNKLRKYDRKKLGLINSDDTQLLVPAEKDFNQFAHLGLNDRIILDGRTYEVTEVDIDEFFDQTSKVITLVEETNL